MLHKTIIATLALGALLAGSVAFAQTNTAPNIGNVSTSSPLLKTATPAVTFPIAELGGCTSKASCKIYCDDATHRDACYAYAQTHGLMRKDEIEKARSYFKQRLAPGSASSTPRLPIQAIENSNANSAINALLATKGGPGGCTSRDACKLYCADAANATACLQFAKEHKLMTAQEIEAAKKLHAQVGPGGCKGEQCKEFCKDGAREQVCVAFALQNGFITKDDAAKRVARMKLSSTTPALPLNADGTERVGSTSPPKVKGDEARPGSAVKPGTNTVKPGAVPPSTSSTVPPPPPPPVTPPQPAGSSTQSSSVFFAILHFFGL